MNKININGKDFTIEELNTLIESAKKKKTPMEELFDFHNITEEEFYKLNGHLPRHLQGLILEEMMVRMYNSGNEIDFSNSSQNKYYPYFKYTSNQELTFYGWLYYCSDSYVPASLLFSNIGHLREAVVKYKNIYKMSRVL